MMAAFTFRFSGGFIVSALTLFLSISDNAYSQLSCNPSYVQLGPQSLSIEISPSADPDTENLQCALNEASGRGISLISLKPGTYEIGEIRTQDFSGTIQGRTIAQTALRPLSRSIDCQQVSEAGKKTALIKFVGGSPRVERLTIDATGAAGLCQNGDLARALIHFTGAAPGESCGADVIFADVDRIRIVDNWTESASFLAAIEIAPEQFPGECKETLLGTGKVNRSVLENVGWGVASTMRGSAQVDINFNHFTRVAASAILINNGGQSTTVLGNTFEIEPIRISSSAVSTPVGVEIRKDSSAAPRADRLYVDNNQFNIVSGASDASDTFATGIFAANRLDSSDIELVVRRNVFALAQASVERTPLQQWSDETTLSSPEFTRPNFLCEPLGTDENFLYEASDFIVQSPNRYEILSEQDYDGAIFLYSSGFNPNFPSSGCLAGNDDYTDVGDSRIVAELQPGSYTLVNTSYDTGQRGNFTNHLNRFPAVDFTHRRRGVEIQGISGSNVSNNRFFGDGRGVIVFAEQVGVPVFDLVITDNTFSNLSSALGGDIYFDNLTLNAIVGPGQSADIDGAVSGNIILDIATDLNVSATNERDLQRMKAGSPLKLDRILRRP